MDLGNLAGGCTGSQDHPVATDADGRKLRMKNGNPDMRNPGVILPEGIKRIILLADLDSESYATIAQLRTAGNRFRAMGLDVEVAWPTAGKNFNDVLISGESMGAPPVVDHPYLTIEAWDDFLRGPTGYSNRRSCLGSARSRSINWTIMASNSTGSSQAGVEP